MRVRACPLRLSPSLQAVPLSHRHNHRQNTCHVPPSTCPHASLPSAATHTGAEHCQHKLRAVAPHALASRSPAQTDGSHTIAIPPHVPLSAGCMLRQQHPAVRWLSKRHTTGGQHADSSLGSRASYSPRHLCPCVPRQLRDTLLTNQSASISREPAPLLKQRTKGCLRPRVANESRSRVA